MTHNSELGKRSIHEPCHSPNKSAELTASITQTKTPKTQLTDKDKLTRLLIQTNTKNDKCESKQKIIPNGIIWGCSKNR